MPAAARVLGSSTGVELTSGKVFVMSSSRFKDRNVDNVPSDACPVCGGKGFYPYAIRDMSGDVRLTCPDCGLICQVLIGPESPSWGARILHWEANFPRD